MLGSETCQSRTTVHTLHLADQAIASMEQDWKGDGKANDMSGLNKREAIDTAFTADSHQILGHTHGQGTKIPVIIYGAGEDKIVAIIAQVLARPLVHKHSFLQVSEKDRGFIVGLQTDNAAESIASRDQNLMIAIQALCCSATTVPDSSLSTDYDYEFLYTDSSHLVGEVKRFLTFILGQSRHHEYLTAKPRSYFLSTTFPDMRAALPNIDILTVGCDAIEIRVDLLREPLGDGILANIPSLGYVGHQIMLLRQRTDLPIIFSCRSTYFSNGRFPKNDTSLYYNYLTRAIQWGVDYIDVELWLPEAMRSALYHRRGRSRIMSAFHDFSGAFQWTSKQAEDVFVQSMQYADIVKMIVIANDKNANLELEYFRSKMQQRFPHAPPLSAVNMGIEGQISRTLNKVFTPVTHPLLPLVAAPGQLSIAEINGRLSTMGQLQKRTLFVYSASRRASPRTLFYQKCLNELGLPHYLGVISRPQHDLADFAAMCSGTEFGGAMIEPGVPLTDLEKASSLVSSLPGSHVSSVTEAARAIGIVDILTVRSRPPSGLSPPSLMDPSTTKSATQSPRASSEKTIILDNTLWKGIFRVLMSEQTPSAYSQRTAVALAPSFQSVSPALFTLKTLGLSKVYAVGFQLPSAASYCSPPVEHCNTLESLQRARSTDGDSPPLLVVSALGPDRANIVAMFLRTFGSEAQQGATTSSATFLDLADETARRTLDISGIARQNGFRPYGTNAIEAFVTVENLDLLLGQNVPPNFVRIAKG